ncbi:MAG: T9SS type A sorting domain-containing protein [Candidatus Marinimicrobia bacterium]|nr:T9SS type A sorting domain-containing protein [Candidatus Neomarinimicrobiota bacterium]
MKSQLFVLVCLCATTVFSNEVVAVISGGDSDSELGEVICAVDWTGDGNADVFVSAPGFENDKGAVFLFAGPIELSVNIQDATSVVVGDAEGDRFGETLEYSETEQTFFVGAPERKHGVVYSFFAEFSSGAAATQSHQKFVGNNNGDRFGSSLAVDGSAIWIGAEDADDGSTNSGSVYKFALSALGDTVWTNTAEVQIYGGSSSEHFPSKIEITDFDFNGITDILFSSAYANIEATDDGCVYIFQNFQSVGIYSSEDANHIIVGGNEQDKVGEKILFTKDVIFGETPDIIIGCENGNGSLYIIDGDNYQQISRTPESHAIIVGENEAQIGQSAMVFSDISGDGKSDIVIGASSMAAIAMFYGGCLNDHQNISAAQEIFSQEDTESFGDRVYGASTKNTSGLDCFWVSDLQGGAVFLVSPSVNTLEYLDYQISIDYLTNFDGSGCFRAGGMVLATMEYDEGADEIHPPLPPFNYLWLGTRHPEWNHPLGSMFSTDMYSPIAPHENFQKWNISVISDMSGPIILVPSFTKTLEYGDLRSYFMNKETKKFAPISAIADTIYWEITQETTTSNELRIGYYCQMDTLEFSPGWTLSGFPIQLKRSNTDSVFSSSIVYEWAGEQYQKPDTFLIGNGYWIGAVEPVEKYLVGNPSETSEILLQEGLQMISSPTTQNMLVEDTEICDNGDCYSWADAVSGQLGWLVNVVYGYNEEYEMVTQFDPWRGYWIATTRAGLTIKFGDTISKFKRTAQDKPQKRIQIIATQQNLSDNLLSFGVDDRASNQFDTRWDFFKPPKSPDGEGVYTYFLGEGYGVSDKLAQDIRKDVQSQQWQFLIEASGTINLSWENTGAIEFDGILFLEHVGIGEKWNMQEVNQAIVEIEENAFFSIQWTSSTTGTTPTETMPEKFAFLPAFPNPFNPEIALRWRAPKPTNVSILIYDINGKQMFSETILSARGTNTRTISSDNFPSGVYFVAMQDMESTAKIHQKISLIK